MDFRVVSALGICCLLGLAQDLNPERARGERIYVSGTSAGKTPVTATLGEVQDPIPASAFPCVNCHGPAGQGKAEGGIVPSDITWTTLTKPYDLTLPSGRKRGPYTEHLLKRAITMGIDSSGNELGAAMPRFQMSGEDLTALLAYLKILGTAREPGLTENQVRIGVILPPARLAEMRPAVDAAVRAYFDEVNRQGGMFQRRIEMRAIDYDEAAGQPAAKVVEFLAAQDVFALTSSFISGDEENLAPALERTKTPLIAAFLFDPPRPSSSHPFVFYFNEGVSEEAKALAAFAARRSKPGGLRLAVVYFENHLSRSLADTVEQTCKASGLSAPIRIGFSSGSDVAAVKARLAQAGYDYAFLLAPSEMILQLLRQAGGENFHTAFLVPGSLASSEAIDLPLEGKVHVFVAVPGTQRGISGEAMDEYRRLADAYRLPPDRVAEQWTALAGAKILVEALRRAGRGLDRETLIQSLQELSYFDTGFGPPLRYGAHASGEGQVKIMEMDFKNRSYAPAKQE